MVDWWMDASVSACLIIIIIIIITIITILIITILIVIAVRTGHCVGRTADDGHWKVGQKDDSRQAQGRRLRAA